MKQLQRLLKDGSETGESLADKFNNNVQDTTILVTNLHSEMLALTKSPVFNTGQHVDQVKILTGDAEEEHILFTNAHVDSSNTFTFDLAEEVILPATAHIQLSPDGHPKMATMTGEVVFTAADTPIYGGGRTGPNPEDYYFLCSISSDGREIKCTLTNPQYLVSAQSSLQLSVYESGIPYNVASEEHIHSMLKDLRRETVVHDVDNPPTADQCIAAATTLSHYVNDVTFWGVDHDFYIQDSDSGQLFLIKYRGGPANTHIDVPGNFWIESLELAV